MQPREALHLPEPKVQAAEHRRQVLSNLSAAGSIYVEVVTYDNDAKSASISFPPDITYPVSSLQGGDLSVRNSDVMHAFRQHSNFAYLTGVHLPGYACLIDTQTGHYTLFAPTVDPQMIVWMGSQPSLDQLGDLHGADACVNIKHLPAMLRKTQLDNILCLEQDKASVQRHVSSNSSSSSSNSDARGGEQQNPLERALVASRAIKTKADIACLQHASDVSTQAHLAMWR